MIKYLSFFVPVVLLIFLTGCNNDDAPDPGPSEPSTSIIIGSYTGYFKFENAPDITEDDNRIMILGEKIFSTSGREYTLATLESFGYIIKLDNLTAINGKVNGKVYLYNDISDINSEFKHIAGDGSFNYTDGKITILWTADEINEGWSISYQSE